MSEIYSDWYREFRESLIIQLLIEDRATEEEANTVLLYAHHHPDAPAIEVSLTTLTARVTKDTQHATDPM